MSARGSAYTAALPSEAHLLIVVLLALLQAYPVMISIVGASALCVWFNWRLFTQQPRIAWDRSRREKEMFKETEEAALNYTNNVFRKMGKEAYMKKLLGSKPVQDKTDYAAQQ